MLDFFRSTRAVMVASHTAASSVFPAPPPRQQGPVISGDQATIQRWLRHYWQKLHLPDCELSLLAITQDRKEYMRWTGKRLNSMVLGCYCYVPAPSLPGRSRKSPSLFVEPPMHRHLI